MGRPSSLQEIKQRSLNPRNVQQIFYRSLTAEDAVSKRFVEKVLDVLAGSKFHL
jgi:hypothetical protein